MSVLDNKARRLQKNVNHKQHHNVLSKDKLLLLFNLQSLSPDTPKRFQNRAVFKVGFLTAMQSTTVTLIKRNQFTKLTLGVNAICKITDTIGSIDGGSKTSDGGWKAIGKRH